MIEVQEMLSYIATIAVSVVFVCLGAIGGGNISRSRVANAAGFDGASGSSLRAAIRLFLPPASEGKAPASRSRETSLRMIRVESGSVC